MKAAAAAAAATDAPAAAAAAAQAAAAAEGPEPTATKRPAEGDRITVGLNPKAFLPECYVAMDCFTYFCLSSSHYA